MQLDREVAVGVANDPLGDEGRRLEPCLLLQLPTGGVLGALARLDLPSRELPEAGQEAGRGALLDEPPVPFGEHDDRRPYVRASRALGASGDRPRFLELEERPARERDRTVVAVRAHRSADRLPKLHHRLVELAGTRRGHEPEQDGLEVGSNGAVADVPLLPGPAGRDPQPVRLERDLASAERDRSDGPCDVRPDPGKRLELGNARGKLASVLVDDPPGGRVEVVRPGVVARPFPDLEHASDRRAGERVDGRKGAHEPLEVRGRLLDSRLLQQHLGDPDPVGVPVRAPREEATVPAIPAEEFVHEVRRRGDRG